MDGQLGEHHSGALRQENAATKAERIMREELQRLGGKEADLAGHQMDRRPGAPGQFQECECAAPSVDASQCASRLHAGSIEGLMRRDCSQLGLNKPKRRVDPFSC
jgi:hypothetical protein